MIGSLPISKITAQEALAVLRKMEGNGRYESARRMRSVLSRVFRYGIATARADRDVARDLRGALITPKVTHLAAITTSQLHRLGLLNERGNLSRRGSKGLRSSRYWKKHY